MQCYRLLRQGQTDTGDGCMVDKVVERPVASFYDVAPCDVFKTGPGQCLVPVLEQTVRGVRIV